MCLAQKCKTGLFARAMQPWLSAKMIVVIVEGKSSSVRRVHSHIASLVAFADIIYSTSINKVTIVCCFLENHKIELPATSKMNLEIEQ